MAAFASVSTTPPIIRDSDDARARALAYAAFSALLASPFDAAREQPLQETIELLCDAAGALPYPFDTAALAQAARVVDFDNAQALRRQYSALFEVGNDGPPVPLRAELVRGDISVAKEEVVRFYDHFGYALAPAYQWAPDHLPVLLEFMQVLALREADAGNAEARLSYRLAQRDFTARHIAGWIRAAMENLHNHELGGCFFARVFATAADFIAADLAWQQATADTDQGE